MEYYVTIKDVIIEEFNDLGIFFFTTQYKIKKQD